MARSPAMLASKHADARERRGDAQSAGSARGQKRLENRGLLSYRTDRGGDLQDHCYGRSQSDVKLFEIQIVRSDLIPRLIRRGSIEAQVCFRLNRHDKQYSASD